MACSLHWWQQTDNAKGVQVFMGNRITISRIEPLGRWVLATALVVGLVEWQAARASVDVSASPGVGAFYANCIGCSIGPLDRIDWVVAGVVPETDGTRSQSDWLGGGATTSSPNEREIPIPAPLWLFGSALLAVGFIGRRKPRASSMGAKRE